MLVKARDITGRLVVAERTPLLGVGIKVNPIQPQAAAETAEAPTTMRLDPERKARLTLISGRT